MRFADPAFSTGVMRWRFHPKTGYGSKHHDEKSVRVIEVVADGKTVTLKLAEMRPTMGMEIRYNVKAASGAVVQGVVQNTVHRLGE